MKRITLFAMLFALISVVAFAQNNHREDAQSQRSAFKGIDRHALAATNAVLNADGELVTPPATAQEETWYTIDGILFVNTPAGTQDFTSSVPTIKVAVDGSDIYIQGLSYYFRDGWIKGTLNGTTATFAYGQLVGADEYGAIYICGTNDAETLTDVVFNYNAEEGMMESQTTYILENSTATEIAPYCYWYRPAFSTKEPSKLVELPDGVTAEEWVITYINNMDEPSSGALKIGFDGNDVYLQGLCGYLPESWIKGSLDGTTITFEGGQYFGFYQDSPYYGYDLYLQPEDVVFTYDAEANKITAITEEITVYTSTLLKGDIYKNAVILKVFEQAATPAMPTISQIYESTSPVAIFSVPVLDVDGNPISSSKLSYQFLSDVEEEISPITFSPDLLSTIVNENPKHLMTPRIPFVVKDFSAGSLGKRCGIQIGDSLVSVNGILTPSSTDLTKALSSCAGDSIVLGYYRDNRYQESHILLGSDGKLGIYAVSDMSRFFTVNHIDYTLLQAIPAGISYGWETLVTYVSSLKILFTKDGAKNLGGFITIATLFPDHWDWLAFWNLTALLAVVLAFMNIIPIPGLDGGHIVITLWEMITRKPVNEKALNVIQNIGMIILLLLLVIANGNDLIKVFNQLMQ